MIKKTYMTNSFSVKTLIHTISGLKPIADVKVGDEVLSFNELSETISYQPVIDVIENEQTHSLVKMTLETDQIIEVTDEHLFYTMDKSWLPASRLTIGQVG